MATAILGNPGHYSLGAATNHFLGCCLECDAHMLTKMPLEQVENWYNLGVLSQAEWEGFTWVWATGAVRFGNYENWQRTPEHEDAVQFGNMMREAAQCA